MGSRCGDLRTKASIAVGVLAVLANLLAVVGVWLFRRRMAVIRLSTSGQQLAYPAVWGASVRRSRSGERAVRTGASQGFCHPEAPLEESCPLASR